MTDDSDIDPELLEDVLEVELEGDASASSEVTDLADPAPPGAPVRARRGADRSKLLAFGVLPAAAVALAAGAAFLGWQLHSRDGADAAARDSVAAAGDATAAILSYNAATVEKDLNAARDRLTGSFLDSYTELINDVVIPGAKEQKINVQARVSAAASVSAKPKHAVALVFVDQKTTVGTGAPTNSASSVRVTLDKVEGRWLVSGFDPV